MLLNIINIDFILIRKTSILINANCFSKRLGL